MEIGLALDRNLGLSFDNHRDLAREAAELGYSSLWTNAGHEQDPFQLCAISWEASSEVVAGGIATGISVVPVSLWTPCALADVHARTTLSAAHTGHGDAAHEVALE